MFFTEGLFYCKFSDDLFVLLTIIYYICKMKTN
nr:MAG TPA: hypothetical protein [Caudoviricetes sp.]DAX18294.1 MAG TPA: hypothetical protein [Caudoviricetes sp.]